MEKKKRIRKTIRMVLKDAKKEHLQKEPFSYAKVNVNKKEHKQ